MRSIVLAFGILIFSLLVFLAAGKYSYLMGHLRAEMFITLFALIAFALGVYFTKNLDRKTSPPQGQKEPLPSAIAEQLSEDRPVTISEQFKQFNLTTRELKVLQELAKGSSNAEIAGKLYLSESTVKTHVSNILFKLQAKRRTEVIRMVKDRV